MQISRIAQIYFANCFKPLDAKRFIYHEIVMLKAFWRSYFKREVHKEFFKYYVFFWLTKPFHLDKNTKVIFEYILNTTAIFKFRNNYFTDMSCWKHLSKHLTQGSLRLFVMLENIFLFAKAFHSANAECVSCIMLSIWQLLSTFLNIERNDCHPSPDCSICLSSFLCFQRRLRRRWKQRNSECGKLEKAH